MESKYIPLYTGYDKVARTKCQFFVPGTTRFISFSTPCLFSTQRSVLLALFWRLLPVSSHPSALSRPVLDIRVPQTWSSHVWPVPRELWAVHSSAFTRARRSAMPSARPRVLQCSVKLRLLPQQSNRTRLCLWVAVTCVFRVTSMFHEVFNADAQVAVVDHVLPRGWLRLHWYDGWSALEDGRFPGRGFGQPYVWLAMLWLI